MKEIFRHSQSSVESEQHVQSYQSSSQTNTNSSLYVCRRPLACVRNKLAVGLATLSLTFMFVMSLKRIVHPKMKIMSSFSPPHVVLNLYDFLASVEDKERYFEECW